MRVLHVSRVPSTRVPRVFPRVPGAAYRIHVNARTVAILRALQEGFKLDIRGKTELKVPLCPTTAPQLPHKCPTSAPKVTPGPPKCPTTVPCAPQVPHK